MITSGMVFEQIHRQLIDDTDWYCQCSDFTYRVDGRWTENQMVLFNHSYFHRAIGESYTTVKIEQNKENIILDIWYRAPSIPSEDESFRFVFNSEVFTSESLGKFIESVKRDIERNFFINMFQGQELKDLGAVQQELDAKRPMLDPVKRDRFDSFRLPHGEDEEVMFQLLQDKFGFTFEEDTEYYEDDTQGTDYPVEEECPVYILINELLGRSVRYSFGNGYRFRLPNNQIAYVREEIGKPYAASIAAFLLGV